jgi:Fe-S-cluster containining protein
MDIQRPDNIAPLLERLKFIFAGMDAAYDTAAAHYGFSCSGCEDNCCTQRFFHYTLAEYFYLAEGVKALDGGRRAEALLRAGEAAAAYEGEVQRGELLPIMCPLNFEGLCSVYEFRPMICRAHGLPHKFKRHDGAYQEGGGCHRFTAEVIPDVRIDRTEFYRELAALEKEFRQGLGVAGKYRRTTAQMLMEMAGDFQSDGDKGPGQSQT